MTESKEENLNLNAMDVTDVKEYIPESSALVLIFNEVNTDDGNHYDELIGWCEFGLPEDYNLLGLCVAYQISQNYHVEVVTDNGKTREVYKDFLDEEFKLN